MLVDIEIPPNGTFFIIRRNDGTTTISVDRLAFDIANVRRSEFECAAFHHLKHFNETQQEGL